jgi:dihydroxyacetone kinase-like protein
MSGSDLRACILAATDALDSAREELCRLDAVAGDGDHGVTMALAGRAVRQNIEESPDADGADLLTRVALSAGSVGGAIGPLYATALLRVAATLRSLEPSGEPSVGHLRACAQAALDGIIDIGHAGPGDKTIVDAIGPAVRALREAEMTAATIDEAIEAAAAAARAGAASTTDMIAGVGRASRLGERSRGSADPGASSFVIIVEAAARAYLERQPESRI